MLWYSVGRSSILRGSSLGGWRNGSVNGSNPFGQSSNLCPPASLVDVRVVQWMNRGLRSLVYAGSSPAVDAKGDVLGEFDNEINQMVVRMTVHGDLYYFYAHSPALKIYHISASVWKLFAEIEDNGPRYTCLGNYNTFADALGDMHFIQDCTSAFNSRIAVERENEFTP
jgi:hypothetical protein